MYYAFEIAYNFNPRPSPAAAFNCSHVYGFKEFSGGYEFPTYHIQRFMSLKVPTTARKYMK